LEDQDEALLDTPRGSFQSNLDQWQNSLDNQAMQEEVKQSLLVLGGLSKRLAKKGDRDEE
jgi:hypothetical protein